jgi:DnaJ-class molecular chaperone
MEYRDYYKTLGVPRTATQADIKKAFRKLARENHPDKKPGDRVAEQRFKDVNEANEVLSDPEKRKRYDELGSSWDAFSRGPGAAGADPFGPGGPFAGFEFAGAGAPGAGGRGPGGGNVRYEFRTSGDPGAFSDFFRMFFGGGSPSGGGAFDARQRSGGATGSLDDLLAGMGRGGGFGDAGARQSTGGGAGARHPGPVEATAELTLEESFHGTTRRVEIGGRRLDVTIPRGVDTGSRVRLSGRGGDGRDLEVVIRVRPHSVFSRKGADLERDLPLTLAEALLGAEVPVTTLKGRLLLTIPAGTQSGRTFRLNGQGMPRLKGDGTGDLLVKVRVILPTHLDDEARAAARRLAELVAQPDPRA